MRISDPGVLSLFTGVPGSGKTTIALVYGEKILKKNKDLVIVTNINMFKTRGAYIQGKRHQKKIEKNRDLTKGEVQELKTNWEYWEGVRDRVITCHGLMDFLEILTKYERILFIFDEAGIVASSGYSGSGKVIGQWEQFIKLSRKFGVSTFWIDQRGAGSIPPTMIELSNLNIHKPNKFLIEIWKGVNREHGSKQVNIRRLTRKDNTWIPFDTLSTASFKMDLPIIEDRQLTIKDLFDKVSDVNYNRLRPTIKEWLEEINKTLLRMREEQERENKEEEARKKDPIGSLKEAVFWILRDAEERGKDPPGPKAIGDLLGRKAQSISRIIREYREIQNAE